jgi:hypothetical protein
VRVFQKKVWRRINGPEMKGVMGEEKTTYLEAS